MTYYRIAGFLLIFISLSHLAGHFLLIPHFRLTNNFTGLLPANETERQMLALMNNYHKDVGGKQMSMMDIQDGLSLCYSLFFCMIGVLALAVYKPIRRNHRLLARISFIYGGMLMAGAGISLLYFFWLPVASFLTASVLFLIAGLQFAKSRQF